MVDSMQKLHVKYNTIHLSRQQDETLILLEISAIFGFVQCFCRCRRICFGAFSGTGSWAAQRAHGTGAAIDGSLSAGVYWNRIRNMKCCSLRGRHPDKFRKFGAQHEKNVLEQVQGPQCGGSSGGGTCLFDERTAGTGCTAGGSGSVCRDGAGGGYAHPAAGDAGAGRRGPGGAARTGHRSRRKQHEPAHPGKQRRADPGGDPCRTGCRCPGCRRSSVHRPER